VLYLGGPPVDAAGSRGRSDRALEPARGVIGLQAVAYHRAAYDRLLGDLPSTPTRMALWLEAHGGIEQYQARRFDDTRLATRPAIAIEPATLRREPEFEPLSATG
jgi:hypothetical protein